MHLNTFNHESTPPRGGYRRGGGRGTFAPLTDSGRGVAPPEFGIFCSYFQNSFSIVYLRERKPRTKQEKYLS